MADGLMCLRAAGVPTVQPLKRDRFRINKSRYDSIDCYLSEDETLLPEYNDLDLVYDHAIYDKLRSEGTRENMRARPAGAGVGRAGAHVGSRWAGTGGRRSCSQVDQRLSSRTSRASFNRCLQAWIICWRGTWRTCSSVTRWSSTRSSWTRTTASRLTISRFGRGPSHPPALRSSPAAAARPPALSNPRPLSRTPTTGVLSLLSLSPRRTSNRPTGRRCGSSRRHPTARSAGASSSGPWRCS